MDQSLQSWAALQEWAQRLYAKYEAAEQQRVTRVNEAGDTLGVNQLEPQITHPAVTVSSPKGERLCMY